MKVVIVDDHRVVREGLSFMLSDHPDVEIVGEAGSGSELMEVLATTEVDIALLDIRMPGMTGFDVLERVRSEWQDTKVIMLTMHDDPAYVRRAIELGASGFLLKSTGRDELVRALKAVEGGGTYLQGEITMPFVSMLTEGPDPSSDWQLSDREREVLQLVADGRENKQIAAEMGVAEATVKTYLKTIFTRMHVRSRAEAVAVALRRGIID